MVDDQVVGYEIRYFPRWIGDALTDEEIHTQSLVSAIPGQGPRIRLSGEVASPIDPSPQACRFHGRCPRGEDRCGREAPVLRAIGSQLAACHFIERLAP